MSVEDMLVQIWHAVVPRRHLRQKGQGPGKARSEDDMIDPGLDRAVFEMHGPVIGVDVRDRRPPPDPRVLECLVAEVDVVSASHDRVDG